MQSFWEYGDIIWSHDRHLLPDLSGINQIGTAAPSLSFYQLDRSTHRGA